ncbi:MAG TPA: AMIN domain-containing protein, partial [Xanthomonadales bacterium]|nr:AMIN domain-containing protein [Xanthomonadales bacterium]
MRNVRKGFLRSIALVLAVTPMSMALADTEVTGISHASGADGAVKITLSTSGDTPQVSVFATESPARIVLDLADSSFSGNSDAVSVGMGSVQQYSAVAAGGRTRLVVDMSQSANYDYVADAGQVVLEIGGGASDAADSPASTAYSDSGYGQSVTDVDFRRGENGEGRVIVSMNRAGTNMAVDEGSNRITVDLFNATLPDELNRRLDVVDFATPVQFIDASPISNGVRLTLSIAGPFEQLAYESGDSIVIEVQKLVRDIQAEEEEQIKFFEEKTYEGTRVTFNFQDIPVRSVLQLIADVSDLNIVVADSVGGNLTLRLTNVPWDQALDIVMDARNLDMRKNGNVIWIGPTAEIAAREQQLLKAYQDKQILEPLQTVLLPMSYSKAIDMKTLIDESSASVDTEYGLLSERGSVTVDERTNTLLITDTAERILAIRELLTELDYAVRQVQIESRIVIASSEFAHELGVRFGVSYLHAGSNIGVIAADGDAADILNPAIDPPEDGLLDIPAYPNRYQVNLPAPSPTAASIGLSF